MSLPRAEPGKTPVRREIWRFETASKAPDLSKGFPERCTRPLPLGAFSVTGANSWAASVAAVSRPRSWRERISAGSSAISARPRSGDRGDNGRLPSHLPRLARPMASAARRRGARRRRLAAAWSRPSRRRARQSTSRRPSVARPWSRAATPRRRAPSPRP